MRLRWWLLGLGVVLAASSCAPGTDGILITDASAQEVEEEAIPDGPPIEVQIPAIPVVRLPALSAAGAYDELLEQRLGALSVTPLEGVEIVNVECRDGDIVYSGDQTSDIFSDVELGWDESFSFEIAEDGSASYDREFMGARTRIKTFPDGAGQFIEDSFTRDLSIVVGADGSGEYYNEGLGRRIETVRANATGAGEYYRSNRDQLLTVRLFDDGGGQLYSEDDLQKVTVDARADGSGEMFYESGERVVTVLVNPDGSWEVLDRAFGHSVSVRVNPERSGQYRERGTGRALTVNFDSNGVTDEGPDIILPPSPRFVVADRFPQLGTLATITPPCATVVRFDSALFFEFNKAELLPEARALLAEIAPALIEAGRSLEINGHTDAIGTEEYNLDLSLRRAQAVAGELRALGVGVDFTVQGFGETQPIADNYRPDGTDNEAGQSQNRRVELVING